MLRRLHSGSEFFLFAEVLQRHYHPGYSVVETGNGSGSVSELSDLQLPNRTSNKKPKHLLFRKLRKYRFLLIFWDFLFETEIKNKRLLPD
jgi:hypothetical protein